MRKRAKITSTDKNPWLRVTIADFGKSYNEKIYKAFSFAHSILHVKYEKLTKKPDSQIKKICDFIETPYDPICFKGKSPDKQNRIFPFQSNVPTENSGEWKAVMTVKEVRQLELICLEIITLLQYLKYG